MLHTLLNRQFWPGNISLGHHSPGPILKLRTCEGTFWLERVIIYCCDIYCCCKTENDLSLFLAHCATSHASGRVLPKPGSACAWRRLQSEAPGCCWLAPSHGFGWHLPQGVQHPRMREVLVWSSKLWWECTRYAPAKHAQTGKPWQSWWGGKGHCPFLANAACKESWSSFVISSCYWYPPYWLLSVAILVKCQHRFGHQGPNPLTMRFVSTLPNRATLSSAILCDLCLTYHFDAMIHDTCLSYTSEMQAPASSHSADHR